MIANQGSEFSKNQTQSKGLDTMPIVSDYMDYRTFLKDFYSFRKHQTRMDLRPYNYQMFSAAANIKSPNYLKMIIEGRRNLSDDMVLKFAKAMGLDKAQTEDFRLLVNFTQSSDPAERNVYLKQLSEYRVDQKLKSGEIDQKTWDKVPNWVTWVIYAMIDQDGVKFDTRSLRSLLRGKASEEEIQEAINNLVAAGEITVDPTSGELKKSQGQKETPDEIPVALVRKLQAQLMYLGLESLYQDAANEREFGTLTLALTKEEFEQVRLKLRSMRKALHKDNAIARGTKKGERVYQLNLQLFPVTNSSKSLDVSLTLKDLLKGSLPGEPEISE
jgi:uncharacterized protein (TIGR02147 family)